MIMNFLGGDSVNNSAILIIASATQWPLNCCNSSVNFFGLRLKKTSVKIKVLIFCPKIQNQTNRKLKENQASQLKDPEP